MLDIDEDGQCQVGADLPKKTCTIVPYQEWPSKAGVAIVIPSYLSS